MRRSARSCSPFHSRSLAAAEIDPTVRLGAVCRAYLRFAQDRPGRYRVMFGGVRDSLAVCEALRDCVDAGLVRSTDLSADTVALWVGLHDIALQRLVATAFPRPDDIAPRLVSPLTGLPRRCADDAVSAPTTEAGD